MSTSDESGSANVAPAEVEYILRTEKVIRGREANKIAELKQFGWELVSQSEGRSLRREMTFRKVKESTRASVLGTQLRKFASQSYAAFRRLAPATQRRVLAAAGGLILILAIVAIVAGTLSGGSNPAPAAAPTETPVAATETPSETPSETPTPTPETDQVITAKNNPEFASLLKGEDCDGAIAKFARTYADRTIEFDGSIVNMAPHGSNKTRFDILLGPGDEGPTTVVGPIFKFEDFNVFDLNLTGKNIPDYVQEGQKYTFIATVDHYTANTCLFFLRPIETQTR